MVYRQAAVRIGAGIALGLLGSVGLVRLIRGLLYQMEPWDPWVFGAVAVGMMAVGFVAVWVPARRASSVDPLVSLRAE